MKLRYLVPCASMLMVTTLYGQEHVLDLTAVRPAVKSGQAGGGSGCGIGESGGEDVILPLDASLVLNRSEYFLGGHVVFDAELTNVGKTFVSLPWSVSSRPGALGVEMSIALVVDDDLGVAHTVVATTVVGNTDKPSTILVLAPGESARFRVPGILNVPQQNAARVADVRGTNRDVRARFLVGIGACKWAAPIMSPAVSVRFKKNAK